MDIELEQFVINWLSINTNTAVSDRLHIGKARALFERLASYGERERVVTLGYMQSVGCAELFALQRWARWCLLHRGAPAIGTVSGLKGWLFAPVGVCC
jgi:hypothetical protein